MPPSPPTLKHRTAKQVQPRAKLSSRAVLLVCAAAVAFAATLFSRAIGIPGLARNPALRALSQPYTVTRGLISAITTAVDMPDAERKLSPREEKEWNHLAEGMDYYHQHFRHNFNSIYELADGKFEKQGMSLKMFLRTAQSLAQHLDVHHNIEERHIFPILAKKMPQFKAGARESGEHLKSHKAIHKGLDRYSALLAKYTDEPSTYSPIELRECLDSFREVLFRHLDEEVHDLGGESMRKAGWTLEEIRRIPM